MKRLLGDFGLTLVSLAAIGLSQLAFNAVVARTHGVEGLGQANVVLSTALFVALFVFSGITPAATKYTSEHLGRKDLVGAKDVATVSLYLLRASTAALSALTLLLTDGLSARMGVPSELFYWSAPLVALYSFYQFYKGMFYALGRVRRYLTVELISRAIFAVALVCLFFQRSNPMAPFVAVYGFFVAASVFVLRGHFELKPKPNTAVVKQVSAYGGWALAGTLSSMGRMRLNILALGLLGTAAMTGYYAACVAIFEIVYIFPRTLMVVLFPIVSEDFGRQRKEQITETLNLTTQAVAVLTVPACGLAFLLPRTILTLLYSEEYVVAAPVVQILALATLMFVLSRTAVTVLSATRYVAVSALSSVAGLVLSLGLWPVLIPKYGMVGAALGYVVGSIPLNLIPMGYVRKTYGLRVLPVLKVVLAGMLAAGAAEGLTAAGLIRSDLLRTACFSVLYLLLVRVEIARGLGRAVKESREALHSARRGRA